MNRDHLLALAGSLRPRQWTKNLVLLAGVIFAQELRDPASALRALAACLIFCVASGAVYVFNDLADIEQDRLHPYKRLRPIASGRLPVRLAERAWAVLSGICLLASAALGWPFLSAVGAFFLWNWAYSRFLKKLPIIDVVGIGVSFVLRALAGVLVLIPLHPGLTISFWLLVCPFCLSLFLGFCKRRNELVKLSSESGTTRPVLLSYSETVLNAMIGASFGLTLAAYAVYTVWPSTVAHFGTRDLVWTTSFVFLGLWRYLYLVFKEGRGGRPHEILLNDLVLQLLVVGWIVVFVAIIGTGS
ncbi:MAG TPA: UbiA prenyltransferase family protein [Candidatus Krumholzibacteria bacterium]|nr:UbiA prenyltransferase family protein [Candidatus Krumholzibacteria bacterium]HPD72734.1 UbiA prenyltransferase family protein [Candidatus Krumholzibacteria bacterium]HRY40334.1 UbiA prenyltransferase family protein [Candidatus Krumholzibacteria bacterium]